MNSLIQFVFILFFQITQCFAGSCCISCTGIHVIFETETAFSYPTCLQSVSEVECDVVATQMSNTLEIFSQKIAPDCKRTAFSETVACGKDGRMENHQCRVFRATIPNTGCCSINSGTCFATDQIVFGRYVTATDRYKACPKLGGEQKDDLYCCADGSCAETCAEFDSETLQIDKSKTESNTENNIKEISNNVVSNSANRPILFLKNFF